MAAATVRSSPLVRVVVNSVQKLYPQALADKSWDNTGLLLEAPLRPPTTTPPPSAHTILLTIDLTRAVVDEALSTNSSMIIAYHPIIFRPLKSLSLRDTQQESLLRLAQAGISVYSPHTAVDAALGGVNDWLADGISGGRGNEESRRVLEESMAPPDGFEGSGMGRMVVLKKAQKLGDLVERVKAYLGMQHLMVAATEAHNSGDALISRIALCAGSGGSMFKHLDVDLFFTGELSHHEALGARERGISTISCFHTNTERGFLAAVMKPKLLEVLKEEWARLKATPEGREFAGDAEVQVAVSAADRDPYEIV
ncbi:NGG1p interacting factor 3 [Morchella conica CCBAS932]|uniref:NGG1p interacting factor 3 n=1 Tax=Morchella conica CCBAS932 TaxID=1392247 RepID=A0A3N4L9U2_9PEZI|nr:NGG1p interacting factor 3 [Morchella conica CCBAS932]